MINKIDKPYTVWILNRTENDDYYSYNNNVIFEFPYPGTELTEQEFHYFCKANNNKNDKKFCYIWHDKREPMNNSVMGMVEFGKKVAEEEKVRIKQ